VVGELANRLTRFFCLSRGISVSVRPGMHFFSVKYIDRLAGVSPIGPGYWNLVGCIFYD
jgi:hypothetical protein